MDPMIDEQRIDAALRRFLAADADALAAGAAGEYEMAARVQTRLAATHPGRRLVLLLAATLVIVSLTAAALAVAAGLIRPPRTLESQGQIVVFVVKGSWPHGAMLAVDPDTGEESSLASIVSTAAYDKISASTAASDSNGSGGHPDISWTSDGSALSWMTRENFDVYDAWIADALGMHSAVACTGSLCRSELSPDGLYLAFDWVYPSVASVLSTKTGEASPVLPQSENSLPGDITWSPDSQRVAVAVFTPTAESIFTVNRDGSGLHELVRWPAAGVVPDATFPRHTEIASLDWSPDGTQIAYLLGSGGLSSVWNLVVQPLDGSDPIVLLENLNASGLAWSPNGRELAVVYEDPTVCDCSSLFVINADGTGLRLVHTNVDGPPSWRAN
jgi:dipeptidyl aminopeptidase/acylaminoacyl peptidase